MTLDEQFIALWSEVSERSPVLTTQGGINSAQFWFDAGAEAGRVEEREAWTIELDALDAKFAAIEDGDALYPLRLLRDKMQARIRAENAEPEGGSSQ